ncbi:helix-turn-helix transcriptional regulator [Cohnella suwonensis]
MQAGLSRQITAADIASQVNISRSYFSQCFKEIVGVTFNEYLRNIRIEKAKAYLIGSGRTVQWIAEHTGYMDERYFSRIFREQTGSLPSEFRKSFRDGGSR